VLDRLEAETDLRRALERNEFRIHYQPILSLDKREVLEVEALLRWAYPSRGTVAPAAFLPLAEETGLIVPIGQWALEEACRQTRAWHVRFPDQRLVGVSVNLSARQFQNPHLVADIRAALQHAGLAPHLLKLEITERVVMHDADVAVVTLNALKELGVQLAIDDFGTGYSSLSSLKRFPVDTLKIDQTFVDGLGHDPRDTAIVRSIVALATALELNVTAEGVETLIQEAELRALGCHRGQGYLFARPLPAPQMEELLGRRVSDQPTALAA